MDFGKIHNVTFTDCDAPDDVENQYQQTIKLTNQQQAANSLLLHHHNQPSTDLNANSFNGYNKGHQLRWAAIGSDEYGREIATPIGAGAYFFPPINIPPPAGGVLMTPGAGGGVVASHHQSSVGRWAACFPPPSLLPWWCASSAQDSGLSNDDTESCCSTATGEQRGVDLDNLVDRLSLTADSATPVDFGSDAATFNNTVQNKQPFGDENFPVNHVRFDTLQQQHQSQLVSPVRLDPVSSTGVFFDKLDDATRQCLRSQLEYYFSRENLAVDSYLKSQMDNDQYVPIRTIANFNKVRKLTSDLASIVSVLKESPLVQVDETGEKVRPVFKRCSLVLREIPSLTDEIEIRNLFNDESCPKVVSCEYAHNNSWYVNFESDDDAQKAFFHLRQIGTFKGKPILARIKNAPIPRLPQLKTPKQETEAVTTSTPLSPPNHKPPMDPEGAAIINGGSAACPQGVRRHPAAPISAGMTALPPAPPGFVWCMAGAGPQPMAPTRPIAPVLVPAFGGYGAATAGGSFGLPYVDINQILTMNSLQQAQGAFRAGYQLMMPAPPANFGDRAKNKRGPNTCAVQFNRVNASSSNNFPMPGINSRPKMTSSVGSFGQHGSYQLNAEKHRAPQPPPPNAVDQFYSSLNAAALLHQQQHPVATAAAAAMLIEQQQRHQVFPAGFGLRGPTTFGCATPTTGLFHPGHPGYTMATLRHPATTAAMLAMSHHSQPQPHNVRSLGGASVANSAHRVYSGRSSSSTSDYWSSKDTPRHQQQRRMNNIDSNRKMENPIEKSLQNEEFDYKSSSFPPLSDTNVAQQNSKLSYAEKAKNAVGNNVKSNVKDALDNNSITVAGCKEDAQDVKSTVVVNSNNQTTSGPHEQRNTRDNVVVNKQHGKTTQPRHRTFRPSVPYNAQNLNAKVEPAVSS